MSDRVGENLTMGLKDRVCVITGGASGIGCACALRYAQEGGNVVVADINRSQGEAVVREIRAGGGTAVFQETDVGEPSQLEALLQRAIAEFGTLHVWHNNAFRSVYKPITEQTLEEFDETIHYCLRPYWYGAKIAATYMLEQEGGVILNTASVQSYFGEAGFSAYQAAKGAILNLSRSVGVECAPKVRSVAIAPGFVHTAAHASKSPSEIERAIQSTPAKRGAQPEEIAALAAYLASEEANFITATGVIADGGYLAI
jgi:NAD(P)-dependent dehydrogenase (short-subunit alcohol dehydrogenase family)